MFKSNFLDQIRLDLIGLNPIFWTTAEERSLYEINFFFFLMLLKIILEKKWLDKYFSNDFKDMTFRNLTIYVYDTIVICNNPIKSIRAAERICELW